MNAKRTIVKHYICLGLALSRRVQQRYSSELFVENMPRKSRLETRVNITIIKAWRREEHNGWMDRRSKRATTTKRDGKEARRWAEETLLTPSPGHFNFNQCPTPMASFPSRLTFCTVGQPSQFQFWSRLDPRPIQKILCIKAK